MGWDGVYGNFKNMEEFFKDYYKKEINDGKILAYEIENIPDALEADPKAVAYAAYKTKAGDITAMVCLLDVDNKNPNRKEFLIKDIMETEQPYECNCPQKILDMLTAPRNNDAWEWRKKCGDTNEWDMPNSSQAMK